MAFRKIIKFKDSIRALADSNTIGSIFTTGGNIGIGTTAPSSKLDIDGDINLTGTLYQNSAPFSTSQWTGSVGSAISYTSGTVIASTASVSNVLFTNQTITGGLLITGGNLNVTSSVNTIGPIITTLGETFANLVPITNGLFAYYNGSSWNGTQWNDLTTNGNHATTIGGTINTTTENSITYLYGNTGASVIFPTSVLPATYTFFHVAKYNGNAKERIFEGVSNNWFSGFWDYFSTIGNSGVAFHNVDFLGPNTGVTGSNNFLLSADQKTLYRANGSLVGTNAGDSAHLSINNGYVSNLLNERSDWAIGEIIVYNRELTTDEIEQTESWLMDKYSAFTFTTALTYSTTHTAGTVSLGTYGNIGYFVGISNTAPNYLLDVNGDINLTGDLYQNGALFGGSQWTGSIGSTISYTSGNVIANTATFTTGGNVGIGNTAPSYDLDVNGDINLTGTLYQNSSPFSTSQWTGSVGSAISYTSGTVILTNGSINNLTISNLTADAATLGNIIMTGGNININTDTTSTNFISFEKLITFSGGTEPNISLSSTSDGGYVVSSSTSVLEPAWTDWAAFNKFSGDGWHSNGPLYNVDYNGSVSTTFANGSVYSGEWIQLQIPTSKTFTSVKLTPRPNLNGTAPRDFVVVGSTSGNNGSWVSLFSTTGQTFGNDGASSARTFTFPPSGDSYNYLRLIINKIGSVDAVQLMEIEYYTIDTTPLYPNTYIGKRIYSGTRASELLLFKGNDSATTEIDRIRLLSAEHRFDTASVQGIFDQIATSGTTRMIVTSSGNVGISTTAPSFTLTVNGTIGAVAVTTGALAATNISVTNLVATNETVVNLVTTNETIQNLIVVDDLLVTDLSSSNSTITNSLITNLSATNLAFTAVSAGSATATIGTVVATNITATNETVSSLLATNVSASNITVTNILITDATVTGTILILGNSLKAVSNSNTVGSIFTTGGNVGIGNTAPSYDLDVNGDVNFTGTLYQNGTPFSGGGGSSQWTGSVGSAISYTSGTVIASNVSVANITVTNVLATNETITGGLLITGGSLKATASANTIGPIITTFTDTTFANLVPITDGLFAYYNGSSWTGTQWTDLTTNGNHATTVGGVINTTTENNITYIYGASSPRSYIRFPTSVLPSFYTFFHVAKYNGNTRQRIFDGVTNNWLSGFWDTNAIGNSGIAFHNQGFLGPQSGVTGSNSFLLSSDQRTLYRANGSLVGVNNGDSTHLSINDGGHASENSDWAVSEIIVYNRELTTDEIEQTESWLMDKYSAFTFTTSLTYSTTHTAGTVTLDTFGNVSLYVGVSNTAPSYTLDINGDINFTGDLYQNGTLFGGDSSQWTGSVGSSISYTSGTVITTNSSIQNITATNVLATNLSTGTIRNSNEIAVGLELNSFIVPTPLAPLDVVAKPSKNNAVAAFQYPYGGGFRHWITSRHNTGSNNGNAIDFYLNTGNDNGDSSTPGTNNQQIMTIAGLGVGIGTGSPTSNLTIYSPSSTTFNIQSSSANTKIYSHSDTRTYFQSLGDIVFTGIDNPELRHLCLRTNGNVGIGTTAPSFNLDVNGTIGAIAVTTGALAATNISVTNLVATNETVVNLITTFETVTNLLIADDIRVTDLTSSNSNFTSVTAGGITVTAGGLIATFNSNTLGNIFTTGGNVGIGNTSPGYTLDVSGVILSNTGSVSNGNLILSNNAGGGVVNFIDVHHSIWGREGYNGVIDRMEFHEFGIISFFTGGFINQQTERMTITSNGNVGIGTTAPSFRLDVNGTFEANNTSGVLCFASTGNVGIGTTTPNGMLHTYNTTNGISGLTLEGGYENSSTQPFIRFGAPAIASATNGYAFISTELTGTGAAGQGGILRLFTKIANSANYNGLSINQGNVGIGTTAPSQIFQVGDAARLRISNDATDYTLIGTKTTDDSNNTRIVISGQQRSVNTGNVEYIATTRGSHIFYNQGASVTAMTIVSSGNVGIGTASPNTKLHVVGDARITGTLFVSIPIVTAAVTFGWNGSSVVTRNAYNVSSVVRNALGNYTVNFTSTLTNIPHVTTSFRRVGTSDFVNVYNVSTTRIILELFSGGGLADTTYADNAGVTIVCSGIP